ncbi:MAG: hypothetical protein RI575_02445 [Balneolaceae bacterium]|nr:hypothetical protein [Balneolaceae bacterium]MDR9410354.1 hypothetical protein [Balneolaceae bacterium]
MATNIDRLSDCDPLQSKSNNSNSEAEDFNETLDDYSSITERLQNLPKIKASNRFDQKMAAAFAMELHREEIQRNRSWLEKHPQISLPDVLTDLTKNFL